MSITTYLRSVLGIPLNATQFDQNIINLAAAIDPEHNADGTHKAAAITSMGVLASSISDGDTTHAPDGNSVFDALALKQAKSGDGLAITAGKTLTVSQNITLDEAGFLSSKRSILSNTLPAFSAYKSATTNNATGNNTEYSVVCDTEIFDLGGNFSAGVFTAAMAGRYQLTAQVDVRNMATVTQIFLKIVTSNRTYSQCYFPTSTALTGIAVSISAFADIDSGDTASVTITINGLGADTANVIGDATMLTFFSGHLVC